MAFLDASAHFTPRWCNSLAGAWLVVVVVAAAGIHMWPTAFSRDARWNFFALAVLSCLLINVVIISTAALRRNRVARLDRAARELVCARCGYDLRGTPDRCPECGTLNDGSAGAA